MDKKYIPEDIRKVNLEINQIVNQRFAISTFAITVFGIIGAWLIPKNNENNSLVIFAGSSLLYIVLLALFIYNQYLKRYLRILSSYLLEYYNSDWERHWLLYRETYKKKAYSNIQSAIFLVLGILNFLFTLFLDSICKDSQSILQWFILFIFLIIYLLLVYFLGLKKDSTDEKNIRSNWRKIFKVDNKNDNKILNN